MYKQLILLIVLISSAHLGNSMRWRRANRLCAPNQPFDDDCNTCVCDDTGTDAVCTLMACHRCKKIKSFHLNHDQSR
ncbi:unnamed protein product, partial [Brenthis ino]